MGLEPMTSPLPRECSTTELHQPSCSLRSPSLRSSIRARIFAITTRNANRLRNKIGIHRTATSRSAIPTYLEEYPCMWITAAGSIVNQDSKPKTTKTPRAMNMRPRSAAGLSDRSLSLITIHHSNKNGAQGRIRTSVTRRVADLQSAAINHSATCALCFSNGCFSRRPFPQPIPHPADRLRVSNPHELSRTKSSAGVVDGERCKAGTTGRYNQLLLLPTHLLLPQKSGAGEGI
jgi:hypothetical protein